MNEPVAGAGDDGRAQPDDTDGTEQVGSTNAQPAEFSGGVGTVPRDGHGLGGHVLPTGAAASDQPGGPNRGVLEHRRRLHSSRDGGDGRDDPDELGLFPASIVQKSSQYFAGPLPHPENLAQYAAAGEDFPERIMRMTEITLQSRIDNNRRESKAAAFAVTAGVFMVGAATVLGLVAAVILAVLGIPYWWAPLTLPIFTVIPRIIRAAKNEPDDATDAD